VPWLPPLSSSEFHELRRLFNEAAGLSFDTSALPVFQQRLASRLPLHEVDNFRDYLRLLQFGPESGSEMAAALDLVTSGETYFFRHDEQLQILAETILPAVAHNNSSRRRISIWSAGCSSGEEAYTTAILLQESGWIGGRVLAEGDQGLAGAHVSIVYEASEEMQSVVAEGEVPEVGDGADDAQERLHRHVLAPLEAADVRSGDVGPVGDLLLRHAGLLPCFSDLKVQLHDDVSIHQR